MSGNRSNLLRQGGGVVLLTQGRGRLQVSDRGEERQQFKRKRKLNNLGREGTREGKSIIILGIGQRWFAYRMK